MKNKRQELLLAIIKEQVIGTQQDLGRILKSRGMRVTQATLSRDLKDLGLIKVTTAEGHYRYTAPPDRVLGDRIHRARRIFSDAVVALDDTGNLIVIKTTNGTAQGVAAALDDLDWPELVGTVAGDNTILVIVRQPKQVAAIKQQLEQLRR